MLQDMAASDVAGDGERGRLAAAPLATFNESLAAGPLPPTDHWIELRRSEGRIK